MALTADAWHRGGKAATLITDAFVTRIVTASQGGRTVARGVTWRNTQTGETQTEEAKVVVMAGGCVENPRLWLQSRLPNPNDWVGRGLTDHHLDWVIGVLPRYTGSSKGANSSARIDVPGRGAIENVGLGPALQTFAATYSDAGIWNHYNNGIPHDMGGATSMGRLMGNDLRRFMQSGVDRMLNMLILTDDDVEADNRVTLSSSLPPDSNGPVGRVQVQQRDRTARTKANREYLVRLAVQVLRKAGATSIHRSAFAPIVLHVHSTMRMGTSASDSVLDASGEARFVKQLFVADNSALPNALGGPNPTLTTQALATRTAERIFQRYFGGDGWVKTESPVRSIDRRVTRAVQARRL
jgi:choline dehydrogenase-like flavoprotein